jgi:hypothetical protein
MFRGKSPLFFSAGNGLQGRGDAKAIGTFNWCTFSRSKSKNRTAFSILVTQVDKWGRWAIVPGDFEDHTRDVVDRWVEWLQDIVFALCGIHIT